MPCNAVILRITVIALGFNSIFNLLTLRFPLLEEIPASQLSIGSGMVGIKMRGLIPRWKTGEASQIEVSTEDFSLDSLSKTKAAQPNSEIRKRQGR